MSNKQMTAVEEAIDLIKQDHEANGRLRLAFVLQTLNKAKEMESQKQQKYDEMLAMLERVVKHELTPIVMRNQTKELIKEAKEL